MPALSAYAEAYFSAAQSEQTLDTQNTWEAVAGTFSEGLASNMSTTAAGIITLGLHHAGRYLIGFTAEARGESAETYEVGIGVDASVSARFAAELTPLDSASTPPTLTRQGLITLSAEATLQLYARCTTNDSKGITFERANLYAIQIG